MNRSLLIASLLGVLIAIGGCSSNPVPPKPTLIGANAEDNALRDSIRLSPSGDTPTFGPLENARQAIAAAQNQDRVNDFDGQSLSQAQQAFSQAQDQWQAIAEDDERSDADLTEIANKAHRAERLAEIAQYTARREIGLEQLNAMQSRRRSPSSPGNNNASSTQGDLVGRRVVPDMLGELNFQQGTARLTNDSHAVIERLAKLLAAHTNRGVAIFGFTNTDEPSADRLQAFVDANSQLSQQNLSHDQKVQAYQQGLSDARAQDVAQLLVQAGVNPQRIGARGMGPSHPAASNDTAAGRRQNERAEAVIVPLNPQGGG